MSIKTSRITNLIQEGTLNINWYQQTEKSKVRQLDVGNWVSLETKWSAKIQQKDWSAPLVIFVDCTFVLLVWAVSILAAVAFLLVILLTHFFASSRRTFHFSVSSKDDKIQMQYTGRFDNVYKHPKVH